METALTLDPHGYVLGSSVSGASAGHHPLAAVVGRHVSCLCPHREGEMMRALDTAARLGRHVHGGWLVRPDGSRFRAETVVTATWGADARLAGFWVVVRDVGVRVRHHLPHAADAAGWSIPDGGSTGETLNALAEEGVACTGSVSCTLYLLDRQPTADAPPAGPVDQKAFSLVFAEAEAASAGAAETEALTAGLGETAREAIASAALVVRDTEEGGVGQSCEAHPKGRPGHGRGTEIGLPLLHQGVVIGAVCCSYPVDRRPDGSDIRTLRTLADEATAAVAKERLCMAAREAAVREERQRLSRELHDTVSQALYSIALGARTARELLDRDATKAAEPIDSIRRLTDTALSEIRTLLFDLRPDELEAEGLVVALTRHVDMLRTRRGVAAEALLGPEPEAAPETKRALYRIAQESLSNAAKHSGARHIVLRLLRGPGTLTLLVTDDGVGFDPRGTFPGHLGLHSMRERAHEVGGTLKVSSRPGRGSRIRATVPARL